MKKTKGSGSLLLTIRTFYRNQRKKLPVLTFLLTFLLAVILAFPSVFIAKSGAFRLVDFSLEDAVFQHPSENQGEVVIIGIREQDAGLSESYGSESEILAKVIEKLNENTANAPAVIGIGFLLSDSASGHERLSEVFSKAGNVVLAAKGILPGQLYVDDNGLASEEAHRFADGILLPSDGLLDHAEAGHVNVLADSDGYVRHYYWDMELKDGTRFPSFAEVCYRKYCEKNGIEKPFTPPTSGAMVLAEDSLKSTEDPNDEDADGRVRRDDGFTYIRYSLGVGDLKEVPVNDILSGDFDAGQFRNKVVLIGSMEPSVTDSYRTAVSRREEMTLTEFEGGMIYNLIHETGMQDGPMGLQLMVLGLLLVVEIMLLIMAPIGLVLIYAVTCIVLAFGGSAIAWVSGTAFHPGFELLYMTLIGFIGMFFRFQASLRTQSRTKELLDRYVDGDISAFAENQTDEGWKEDKVAVLFADLRSFTTFSEKINPEDVLSLLNEYLSMADACIHRYGGRLDKFIGDCVMATWSYHEAETSLGANVDKTAIAEDINYRACCAALDIIHECGVINEKLEAKYHKSLRFGIGINYGPVVAGNVGSESHSNRTVIGDIVNVASRIESLAPSGTIYITKDVHDLLGTKAKSIPINNKVHLKGRYGDVGVYALQSLAGLNRPSLIYDTDSGESFTQDRLHPGDQYFFYVLGCRGSRPVEGQRYAEFGGQTSSYIIKTGNHALVVDCGSGLYDAARYLKDCTQIDVVLTHVHYDHIIGLLCWGVFPTTAKLTFYGSFEKWFGRKSFEDFYAAPFWPVQPRFGDLVETPKRGIPVRLGDGFFVSFYDSPHPDDTCIVKVNAGDSSICFMADCEHATGMPLDVIDGSDILIYDGMFTDEEYPNYAGFGHSTWQEGCRLAERAHVKRLIITHHDPKNYDKVLMDREQAAKEMFPNVSFARAGDFINLNAKK